MSDSDKTGAEAAETDDSKVGKLVFATGYQRSGTTVLLRGFQAANDPDTVFNESPDSLLFTNKNLHPARDIRVAMRRRGRALVAKPNKLFQMVPMARIANMYRAFDMRIVWSVRNPVDVYASKWVQKHQTDIAEHPADVFDADLVGKQSERLDNIREAIEADMLNVLVIRYEDLVAETDLPEQIRAFTGVGFQSQHSALAVAKAAALSDTVSDQVMSGVRDSYDALCAHAAKAKPLSNSEAAE